MKISGNLLYLNSTEFLVYREWLQRCKCGMDLHMLKFGGYATITFLDKQDLTAFKMQFGL